MRALATALSLHKPASRQLGAAALILLASGLCHLLVLVAVNGQWAGPISLRKPITFGFSMGMLIWTLGWVIDRLPSRPRLEAWLGYALAGSGLLEVALITVQAWRGVPSHFNYTTVQDLVVFVFMGTSIAVLSAGLLVTTGWAVARPPSPPAVGLAVRAGLVLAVTGLGIGQWMIELGNDFVEQFDRGPDQVLAGDAGTPTFPHALAFHGIQVFILAAIVPGLLGLSARAAQRIVRLVVSGYSLLLLWSIVQAATGRAPLDPHGPETALAVVGIGCCVAAAAQLLVGYRATRTSSTADPDPRDADPAVVGRAVADRETVVPSAL